MATPHAREIERIRRAYERRDAAAGPPRSPWLDPAYAMHVYGLERGMLSALAAGGATLEGARVLEVGCGAGQLLHRLVEFGAAEGAGVDLMENRVGEARRRYPRLDVRQADAAALPFGDAAFDVVAQFTCLSSVLDADVRGRIAAEMWRVLRPGGAVLSYDMRPSPAPVRAARRLVERFGRAAAAPETPIVQIGPEELRRLFPVAPATERTLSLNPALAPVARASPAAATALTALPPLRSHLLAVIVKPAG